MFLCHSLGGIILKRVSQFTNHLIVTLLIVCELLVLARRRSESSKHLFSCLVGIIFLGTPHLRETNKSEWDNVPAILELHTSSLSQGLRDENQLRQLATWSEEFQTLNLSVPVRSTREQRRSKKRKKILGIVTASEGTYVVVGKPFPWIGDQLTQTAGYRFISSH